MSDVWEMIRHLTMDQLVTQTKLSGSALVLNGFTTPEKWPFTIVLAVAKPGNELAVQYAQEFFQRMATTGAPRRVQENPKLKGHPANPEDV